MMAKMSLLKTKVVKCDFLTEFSNTVVAHATNANYGKTYKKR